MLIISDNFKNAPRHKKVILGLSGGVDSTVCAALLRERGYAVLGVYLDVGALPGGAEAAAAAAASAGISFAQIDVSREFDKEVCAPFAREYARGRTPNPCVHCNPEIKFRTLADAASRYDAAFIATGHYAQVSRFKHAGRYSLIRAGAKDQTYMLYRLPQDILARLILPLGTMRSKGQVRARAMEISAEIARRPDSMEICFIQGGDHAAFVESRGLAPPPGDFVDAGGKFLGRHKGMHHYTVGQRRGLGLAMGQPAYVTGIDGGRVTIGRERDLYKNEITVSDTSWMYCAAPAAPFDCAALLRHPGVLTSAHVYPDGDAARVTFADPVRAPAPGQAAVFYRHGVLIGGGTIVSAGPS